MTDKRDHVLAPNRARSGEDPLLPFLISARGRPVTISARDVRRIDALRAQTLLAAHRQWTEDGVAFRLTDIGQVFRQGLERLGLDPDHFDKDATQ